MSRSRSNKCRDPIASLTLPAPGARMISIRAQAPEIQTVIKAAIRKITGDALFLTAYPSAITLAAYLRDTLATTAKDLKLSSLSLRFQGDHKFGESISRVVCHPSLILSLCLIFDHSSLFGFQPCVAT